MSNNPDAGATSGSRTRGLVFSFVLGAAMTAVVMAFFWSSDSARQEERIRQLSAQISEKDATIGTLYAQLKAKTSESPAAGGPPTGENP